MSFIYIMRKKLFVTFCKEIHLQKAFLFDQPFRYSPFLSIQDLHTIQTYTCTTNWENFNVQYIYIYMYIYLLRTDSQLADHFKAVRTTLKLSVLF